MGDGTPIESISAAPTCTALYNLLKYSWFPYDNKVVINK